MKDLFDYRSSKALRSAGAAHPLLRFATSMVVAGFCFACGVSQKPPRQIPLPLALQEASGLVIESPSRFWLHNDSGDGPNLYSFNPDTRALDTLRLAAGAGDWEDITADTSGHLYVADTGNNLGIRLRQRIYRHNRWTGKIDTITFVYPNQDGQGRIYPGNYDCEAIVHYRDSLHLFTKAIPGRRKAYWAYHFRLPARPGRYRAELVDSLYLPRRTITAATLDTQRNELILTAYNYKRWLGFFPAMAASLITITDYPDGHFFRGQVRRRNLSWAVPTQFEAIDIYDKNYVYIATERTILKRQSLHRKRRR